MGRSERKYNNIELHIRIIIDQKNTEPKLAPYFFYYNSSKSKNDTGIDFKFKGGGVIEP
jgi:hypothetical protein